MVYSKMNSEVSCLRQELAGITGTECADWFPVFKARYGMRAVFKALKESYGTIPGASKPSVLTLLYTCCTAVDPIISAGLSPQYADVNADSLAIDVDTYSSRNDLGALVVQNTFGFISNAATAKARDFADSSNLLYVEDSAHCIGRMAKNKTGHPQADVSIHSFGVEKILAKTHFGGAIWVNPNLQKKNPELHTQIVSALQSVGELPARQALAARLYLNQIRILSRLPQLLSKPTQKILRSLRLFEPAISPAELRGELEYPDYGITESIANKARIALAGLEENYKYRQRVVGIYQDKLHEFKHIKIPRQIELSPAQPLLVFPILLQDANTVNCIHNRIRELGAYSRRWYNTVLFPGVENFESYKVTDLSLYPVTTALTQQSLGLPTDAPLSKIEEICEVLAELDSR